jgi:hypothetical protein
MAIQKTVALLTDFFEASDMSPMAAAAPRRAMVVAGVAVKQLAAASFFGGHRRIRVGDQDTTWPVPKTTPPHRSWIRVIR